HVSRRDHDPRDSRAGAGRRARGASERDSGCDGEIARARRRRVVTNDVELVVVETPEEVALAVAERLARAARAGGHNALTGGPTPERAYEEAAQREPDWSNAELWWSDERCVPPDDELSNYHLAKRTLLDNLEREARAVHRIKGELGKEKAAADYERDRKSVV